MGEQAQQEMSWRGVLAKPVRQVNAFGFCQNSCNFSRIFNVHKE